MKYLRATCRKYTREDMATTCTLGPGQQLGVIWLRAVRDQQLGMRSLRLSLWSSCLRSALSHLLVCPGYSIVPTVSVISLFLHLLDLDFELFQSLALTLKITTEVFDRRSLCFDCALKLCERCKLRLDLVGPRHDPLLTLRKVERGQPLVGKGVTSSGRCICPSMTPSPGEVRSRWFCVSSAIARSQYRDRVRRTFMLD